MRDEVRADEAIRGVSADEEAAGEQPEVPGAHRITQRCAPPVLGAFSRGTDRGLAERYGADLVRTIAHEDGDRDEHHGARDEHDADRPSPPLGDGELRHGRDEYQLAGAGGCAEGADDHTPVRAKPTVS